MVPYDKIVNKTIKHDYDLLKKLKHTNLKNYNNIIIPSKVLNTQYTMTL